MSSSFVKDCTDVSSTNGNSSNNKTVIIIVNNETGNVDLDGAQLQNLLGKLHILCILKQLINNFFKIFI